MAGKIGFFGRLIGRSDPPAPRMVRQMVVRRGARAEYDGATLGKRSAGWRRTNRDANGELTPEAIRLLRAISRDLVRNNPFAARGVSAIAANMVGTGITFQVYRDGAPDPTLQALARQHFETPACDANGRHDLYGLQLQAARTIAESGAVFVRRRWRRPKDGLPVPFQLQVVEPDYLDPSKNGLLAAPAGVVPPYCVNGVQFSAIGQRTGYWLYAGHPGSVIPRGMTSSLIPATEIIHAFRQDRPEQENGAPWLAPVILRMKDFGDYEDAQLQRQKLAAAYTGIVTGEEQDGIIPGIATDDGTGADGQVGSATEPLDYIEPGTFAYLRPGEEVTFSNPPSVEGYADYSKVSLRAFAAGLGVPYEALTGDLSGVNFSSGRMGWLEFQRSLATWQWEMFIPTFCRGAAQWFLDAVQAQGGNIDGVSFAWTPPRREMIDPATEVPAIRDAIRSGIMDPFTAIRERGEDPETVINDWKRAADLFDKLGLVFDCDPRRVTQVGNVTWQGSTQPSDPAAPKEP